MTRLLAIACLWAWGWGAADPKWLATNWNGEKAQALSTHAWVAVVSLERGRLVEFRAEGEPFQFLNAPTNRIKNRWGGHRVWLGPQRLWKETWPPPDAWEHRAPERISASGPRLELAMGDAGDGWPKITRVYRLSQSTLVCEVRVEGGQRSGQILQIFQIPFGTEVRLHGEPGPGLPMGALWLPEAAGPEKPILQFPTPYGITRHPGVWVVQNPTNLMRLGLAGHPMAWAHGSRKVVLARTQTAPEATWTETSDPPGIFFSNPARGFHEVEQLSPTFQPGQTMVFAVALDVAPRTQPAP